MKLTMTRAILDAIHAGALADVPTRPDPVFGVGVPTSCPGVPTDILQPRSTWPNPAEYDDAAARLAQLFINNFKQYESVASPEVRAAGPG
jgi:phosphoenolpyruvate carboxykinase (ATP)